MGIKRREFLKKVGWAVGAMGLSEGAWWQKSDRYHQALAQSTNRKLALLIGINQYGPFDPLHPTCLRGCVTDVELQKELLIYRFGFQPSDILTLTDSQATRENIENGAIEHLLNQAKADDLVVFHFSGYGSQVIVDQELLPTRQPSKNNQQITNSLVPVDSIFASEVTIEVNDILTESLSLLLQLLPTNQIITILDTCYNYPGTELQGNLRIRARSHPPMGIASPTSLQFANNLRQRQKNLLSPLLKVDSLKMNAEAFPGLLLVASQPNQIAAEKQWNGFTAGLFTYALTQSLWWMTDSKTWQISLTQASRHVNQIAWPEQQPQIITKTNKFPLLGNSNDSVDGVITAVDKNTQTVQLWLGGTPPYIIPSYGVNTIFTVSPNRDNFTGETGPDYQHQANILLQIRSRLGLTAKAQIKNYPILNSDYRLPEIGQTVQEKIRIIPQQINLNVALDHHLERIEKVDATSGFAAIPQISVVVGDQPVDYLFGRVQESKIAQVPNTPLPINQTRYGLFSLTQNLLTDTTGAGGEAVKVAVQRLTPYLKNLLAVKLLKLTINEGSSRLAIKASLVTLKPEAKVIMERGTWRTVKDINNYRMTTTLPNLVSGSHIEYWLQNQGDLPFYFILCCFDSSGRGILINPNLNSDFGIVAPGQTVKVPSSSEQNSWILHNSHGLLEVKIICSQAPFSETVAMLPSSVKTQPEQPLINQIINPLKLAQAILQDLQNASLPAVEATELTTEDWALDVSAWATLNFVYQVS